jgi:hypothetical protein
MRRRIAKIGVAGALAAASVLTGFAVSSPASADRSDCSAQLILDTTHVVVATCPAGADQFSFRAMGTCLSLTYPNYFPVYGPWTRASGTQAVSSQFRCGIGPTSFGIEFR